MPPPPAPPPSPHPDLAVHHVGIACRDLPAVRRFVEATHTIVAATDVVHDDVQEADLCLLTDRSGLHIELVAGPVVANLLRKGHTYYHLCYEVEDLESTVAWLETEGCRQLRPPTPAPLFDGRRVCFLVSPTGIIELLERDPAVGTAT
ncbi:MAG: VOC family protein [Actinomycetota bacterium]|nr:VOC family protein [Actinomycetota bacterium]